MPIDKIIDHQTRAKARLPGFMQGKTNIEALLDAFVSESQSLEDVFFQLLDQRHLTVATGTQLDGIGQIVDLDRNPTETDSNYRTRLIARAGELAKGGEIETLLTSFINLTVLSGTDTLDLSEVWPATVIMTWLSDDADPQDPAADAELVTGMNAVRAGGVRLDLMRNEVTNNFQFSDESEIVGGNGPLDLLHGFGDEALTDGGQLGRRI